MGLNEKGTLAVGIKEKKELKVCWILDPTRGRMEEEIMEDCGIMCYLNL